MSQGKLGEAEPLYKESLAIKKKVFGDEHPQVALGLNNLAVLLEEGFGNYEESYKLKKEALAIRKKVFGDEHPDVAGSLNNLAELLMDQVRYKYKPFSVFLSAFACADAAKCLCMRISAA